MKPASVALNIDKLVIQGMQNVSPDNLKETVEQTLSQMLNEQGIPAFLHQDRVAQVIQAPELNRVQGSATTDIGYQIAQAVYGALNT